jgi:hypothetical protein
MHNSAGDHETLPGLQFHCAVFQIHKQQALDNIEEFIVLIVLVPMVFALHNCHAHHRVIDLAECLVPPPVLTSVGKSLFVNYFQRAVEHIE